MEDNLQNNHAHNIGIIQPYDPSIDLDDAFSDGEDKLTSFDFTSAALREEMVKVQAHAQHMERDETPDQLQDPNNLSCHQSNIEADTSVSTFELDASSAHAGSDQDLESHILTPIPPPETHRPQTELAVQFGHISLSEDSSISNYTSGHGGEEPDRSRIGTPGPEYIPASPPPPSGNVKQIDNYSKEISTDAPVPDAMKDSSGAVDKLFVNEVSDSHQTPHSAPPTTPSFPPPTIPKIVVASSTSSQSTTPETSIHRSSRSVSGPSAFEKVVSRTRPTFLPPKPKTEDLKHLHDWEEMMKQSRAAASTAYVFAQRISVTSINTNRAWSEQKRRKALQARRLAREQRIEESLQAWQKHLLEDWRAVHKNPALKRLWWKGIPTSLRATMWEKAVGNALALDKGNYRTCVARAKRARSTGTFPEATLKLIETDISSTLPSLHIFLPGTGPLYDDLYEMLAAWVVSRFDEGLNYSKGVARIAGMLLLTMSSKEQAFIVLRNLLERHCMRSFYGGRSANDDVEAYYRIFDTLLADGMPKIYFNFKQHQISPAAYLPDWIMPLFLDHLPFEACARIWDVLVLEGDSFVFRVSLAILAVLEPRLFFPDRRELLELLKGENKAAIEVAKREGRSLDGGKYEIYGLDEETLWERIDSMDDWWKDSTWKRLLQRELPDV
ncbi:RabGAP/TBC [Punctularia strigosozonata HHB-11173 SS5]|uniref:RabGAP/TBC n=1 Tax=Punctularia strigosozonata (strain HHB-11173) TaxID=741275 RepID=UPI000441661A|nr:RabGAP/TBC [Punctularia strigosozonata HHB-11173 SS5]EIN13936.1 RabGAP/TBC [Punctularia strigosozonata HHB-11173 SS5]